MSAGFVHRSRAVHTVVSKHPHCDSRQSAEMALPRRPFVSMESVETQPAGQSDALGAHVLLTNVDVVQVMETEVMVLLLAPAFLLLCLMRVVMACVVVVFSVAFFLEFSSTLEYSCFVLHFFNLLIEKSEIKSFCEIKI